ncbi:hypothetical protein Hdeb2414_s0863g00955381 [Helianthus debilis subsp. tardiflorus]
MTFRGKEDIVPETTQTPLSETWNHDLKDVPTIELPERALVAAGMSFYRRLEREDKPIYMEGEKIVSLYVVAYKREHGVPKRADEELWYLQIVKNFALPRDEDLSAQPPAGAGELTNLGIVPEKKKRAPAVNIALKKTDAAKAQSSKVKNVKGEKKGTRHSSDSWCDYVVVSDSLEGLAPVVVKKLKAEPRDTADIPASNPEDQIDLESSPEPLVKTKTRKRKQVETEAKAQPAKKIPMRKISKRGNLDAFITKPPLEKSVPTARAEPSSVVNDDLPLSPPRASISEQLEGTKTNEDEAEKTAEAENPEVEKSVEVESEKVVDPETADADATHPKSPEVVARDLEKGKSVPYDPVITIPASATTSAPVNVVRSPSGGQGFSAHSEENSPIRPKETSGDYYYRTYLEKQVSEVHAPVWKLKKGDTFSDWRVCHDWIQGTFPPGEVKFHEDRSHEQSYYAYLEEDASFTSTTHRIVRKWHSMYKEWSTVETSRKRAAEEEARVALLRAKLEADQARFENDWKTKEWSVVVWKRKA